MGDKPVANPFGLSIPASGGNKVSPAAGDAPANVTCQECKEVVEPLRQKSPKTCAWIGCILIFLMGGVAGCCLIPCCYDSCLEPVLVCPKCKYNIENV